MDTGEFFDPKSTDANDQNFMLKFKPHIYQKGREQLYKQLDVITPQQRPNGEYMSKPLKVSNSLNIIPTRSKLENDRVIKYRGEWVPDIEHSN